MATSTVIDWSKYFDHIYCLHYLPDKARLPVITEELDRVGILNSGIFSFYWTFQSVFDAAIRKSVKLMNVYFHNEHSATVTNITYNNYRIVRESLGLGYNRILILEDDVLFLHDLERIKDMLEHMPEDWEFIQFDRAYKNSWMQEGPHDGYYMSDYVGGYTSSACNAYARRALPRMADALEREFYLSDRFLVNTEIPEFRELKRYLAMFNIAKQDDRRYDDGYRDLLNFDDFYPRLSKR